MDLVLLVLIALALLTVLFIVQNIHFLRIVIQKEQAEKKASELYFELQSERNKDIPGYNFAEGEDT